MTRRTSQAGLKLIQSFEGCRLTAYKPVDTEIYFTIGWGHYGIDVKKGQTITQKQADDMFVSDLVRYENYVNDKSYVPIELNQNQFDSLVSFCYNCGNGNLKKLCAGRTAGQISVAMMDYTRSSGKVLQGLVRRRQAERDLFLTPVKEDEYMIPKQHADQIIAILGQYWEQHKKDKTISDYTHFLANEIRKASNQETT